MLKLLNSDSVLLPTIVEYPFSKLSEGNRLCQRETFQLLHAKLRREPEKD